MTLVKQTKTLRNDKETAKVLNNFFSTTIGNLKILQYNEQDQISDSISDPVMRTFVKSSAYPSVIAIKENFISSTPFNLSSLEANKATSNTDIPTFTEFTVENLNDSIC